MKSATQHAKLRTTRNLSGKFRKKRERDRFGSLIDQEESSSKAAPSPASLLPNKRSVGLDNPQKGDKLISADHDDDKVGNNLPAMLLEKRIKKNDDDVSEAASRKSPTSLRLEDPVEGFASIAAPFGFSSSASIGQPISAAFELESSPLARHSSRNAYVSSVRPEKKKNTASQNQSQESASFDSGEPEDGPYRPPSAQRAKAEVTSTLRNMDGTLLKREHDGITSVLDSATEPSATDCEPTVPTALNQPRLISAKGLDNLQLSDAIPQRDAGEVRAVMSRSQIEGRLTSEKRQMEGNVARHHKDVIQHRRVQVQPKRVVSSNSKKVPESPGADSKAITIHIPQRLLMTSKSLQTPAQPLMDPFHGQASTPGRPKDETRFMRNLRKQMEENARTTRMKRNDGGRECADDDDPDRTLVDMIEDAFDMDSAEDKSSTALVSSTDAESNGHYEKMEWERSLKPHQRDIFDVLTRISRHFVRHLIDSETAIEDILQDFEADGTRLIELMEETHRKEYDTQRKCLLEARTHLSRALLRVKDRVVEHERQARITLLSNSWEQEESVSKKHISHLEKMLNQMADP
ncbi:hypothetical protein SLS58_008827 [Diplodia intermedia]|uniref:Extracellular mutant protein 11 C-terminal domain-containing protein n=1 Tax=Diplodia intermedia TaxID=856260 RepID=A0ABR3TGF7_9PEZI